MGQLFRDGGSKCEESWFFIWRQCTKDDASIDSLEYFGPSYKVEREGQKDDNLE